MAETGTVTVQGVAIGYLRAGDGQPLVLLHGIGGNASQFRQQVDGLSDAYDVVAWDTPGYGRSDDPPREWAMADYADALAGFLDSLSIARAHLLGQSWGGVLAQVFYGRYPDRVRSLILSDTTLGGDATRPDSAERLAGRLRALETMTPAEMARARVSQVLGPNPPPDVSREVEEMLAQIRPVGYRNAAIALDNADTRAVLPHIAVPVLVICGEHDEVAPASVGTQLIGQIPNARRVIQPSVGHLGNQENPEQYNATVREFLRSVETTQQ